MSEKQKKQEYEDVFPNDVPSGLPPIRGIEHQIDFVPGATIPNRPAYRSNLEEIKELQRQVEELLAKGHGYQQHYGEDSRSNPFEERGNDGNQSGPSLKDPLQVPDGPITRSRAKKIKEAMQGLVQSTWDEASKSPTIKVTHNLCGVPPFELIKVFKLIVGSRDSIPTGSYHFTNKERNSSFHPLKHDKSSWFIIFKLVQHLQFISALHPTGNHEFWYCSRSRLLNNSSKTIGNSQDACIGIGKM
uniref:Uncharacterized protein n=1 Tax=Fagus sylvatica TaxID=28930 RepID=A0A2N9H0A0_FAGSY